MQALGIKLPALPESFGDYVEAMQTGNLLFLWAGLSLEYPDRVLSSEDKQVELIQSEKDQCPKKSTINAAAFWVLWP
ncbi:MAG: hypothetical protein KME22_30935 [Hassallia sp. WJT32-NPBG1]|nr:hypothetical protein [Hassallia sp. WJT32-NPBG1]